MVLQLVMLSDICLTLFFRCFLDDVLVLVLEGRGNLHLISMIGLDSLLLLGWVVLGPLPALILPSMLFIYRSFNFIAIYGSGWLRTYYIPSRLLFLVGWMPSILLLA